MTRSGDQPQAHSTAHETPDGRLSAPSARRNRDPILKVLRRFAPRTGRVLEIAAGTGEHAAFFSANLPALDWQPSDIAPGRLASIEAWRVAEGGANQRPAIALDASLPDWDAGRFDMVLTVNLLHLIADDAAENVIAGVARALLPAARWLLYGPFRQGGAFRSEGDASFHAQLAASDPAIGYKSIEWVERTAHAAGLIRRDLVGMPANNLMLILEKPGA